MSEEGPGAQESRWTFIRDVVVFQLKLVLDGLRDAALIPVSLVAGSFDLLSPGPASSGFFYRVVSLGRRSEAYIDLFEAADRLEPRNRAQLGDARVDDIFHKVEDLLREHEQKGGLTASAREQVDRLLDTVAASRRR